MAQFQVEQAKLNVVQAKVKALQSEQPAQGRTKAQIHLEYAQANLECIKLISHVIAAKYEASEAALFAVAIEQNFNHANKALSDARMQFSTDKEAMNADESQAPALEDAARKVLQQAKLAVHTENGQVLRRKRQPK